MHDPFLLIKNNFLAQTIRPSDTSSMPANHPMHSRMCSFSFHSASVLLSATTISSNPTFFSSTSDGCKPFNKELSVVKVFDMIKPSDNYGRSN